MLTKREISWTQHFRARRTEQSANDAGRSPREGFEFLGKWYDPENEMATQYLFDKFHEFSIPQNSNPIVALHALEDIHN